MEQLEECTRQSLEISSNDEEELVEINKQLQFGEPSSISHISFILNKNVVVPKVEDRWYHKIFVIIFSFMLRNSYKHHRKFNIPEDQTIELGHVMPL